MDRRIRQRGHTLLETTLSAGVVVLIAGGLFSMLSDSGARFGENLRAEQQRREGDGALARFARELEQAEGATLVIDRTDPAGDLVRLRLPLDVDGPVLTFGASEEAGGRTHHHVGAEVLWSTRSIQGRGALELVRRIVANDGVTLLAEEVVCDDLEVPAGGGARSFEVALAGRVAAVTLRRLLLAAGDDGAAAGNGAPAPQRRLQEASVRIRSL